MDALIPVYFIIGVLIFFWLLRRFIKTINFKETYRLKKTGDRHQLSKKPNLSWLSRNKSFEFRTIPHEKPKGSKPIRQFVTKVVGVTFENYDGSSRQDSIKKNTSWIKVKINLGP